MLPPLDSPLAWFGFGIVIMALVIAVLAFLTWLSIEHERTFIIVLAIMIMLCFGGPLGLLVRTTIVGPPQQNLPAEKP